MAGPRQRTDDAQGADRAGTDAMRDLMRQAGALGPMIPRPGMTESTRAALERADAAARPVVEQTLSWARAIEQRMPMDIGAARRQLGTLIPENEREGYHGQLEMLDHMMRDAERLQASGDARAAEALQHVRLALEGLGNTYHTATRAREAHLSDEVVGAVRSSFFDMGRGDTTEQRQVFQERSETTRRLAEFRIEHPVLASQDMTPAARAVDSWIVNLGTAATLTSGNAATDSRAAREQTQTVNQGFQQLRTLVNDVEASSRSIGISTLRDYSDQMLMMAAQIRDQTFREELQRTREAIRQMTERMEGDPAARVNEGEIQKLEAQIAFFINARDQILAGTEGTPDGQQLEAILGRGMRAIRENHADQAQVQLFIAGIYRDGSSSLKGELRAVSEGLANGTMTMEQATQRLGTYYTRELGTLAGTGRGAIQDQESRDMIGRITAGFSGRTLTVNDLARLAATYDIARDIKRHEDTYRNARGANRQAANEALGIYRSALHAIEIGAPIGAAAMQREFARKYMTADATMRENIRGMSARLETAENIRAMQGRLGDSTDPAQISAAARAVLGPGVGENDPRIAALVSAFNQAGHNAQERLAFVQGVETEANTFLQLMQRRDGIRTLLDQTVRQRLGERERQLYDRALGAIDGVLRSLGLGQQVSPTQLQSVQIQTIMLVGEPPLISAAFATSQDPQERQAQLQATDGLQSMTQIIRGIRDPVLRTQVAYIYGRGQEALAAGRVEEARSYFQLAQAAATTRSSEDRDRIFSITTRMQNVTEGQYVVTPEQASWFGRHFLDRAQMQARISDPAQRRTYNTYMDLALRMHIDGDENGSMFMFNLASMYGRAAALGGNDPQVRAALAIPQGNAELGIPSLQSLVQEFMPYRAGVTGTLDASHLIDEMEPRHAPAEGPALRTFAQSLGAGESDSATRIQRLALALVPMQLGVDQAEFARGSVDPAARASAARYSAERRRLEERLTRTTDPLERERLQREISVVDPTVLTQRQQRATSDYAEGVTLMTQAADLRRQSLDKTAQAAATTDTTERQRLQREAQDLNSRADGLAQRAGVLMQSAQGLRGTVEGTHRSITTVLYTNHRERGRIALDAAALDYIAASDEARRGEGPMSQGQMGIIGSRMQAAEGERRLGLFEVARQAQIQRQKGEMNQAIQRLHDQNVAARDRSTDTGQAGGTQVRLPNADEEGHPVQSGPPAYDYDGIERRIASARGMVGAERFPEAGRSMRGIGQVIQLNETRASIYRAYWSYLPGAGDIERSTGSLHYLDASRLGGLITTAIEDADAGRFDQSRGGLWNVQELFMVQSEQQRRWNYGVLIDNLAGGVDRDLSVADPGTPGYDPNNPRSFGYVPDEERRRDPRRYQAHLRNMQAIASTGLFGNLRRDREGAREDLRAAARAQRDSAAAIESSDDIINGPGGLREGLGDEMIAAAVSHDRRQTGLGRLAGPTYSQDRVSGFIERGDTQGLMNLLNRDTALRESVLSDLQSRGVITAAGATALRADIQAGGTLTSFQDRSVGWNYATMAAGRVQEFFDTVDDTTRFRSVDHMMRDAMRSNGIGLLGNALWASSHAGQVPGVLRRGGTIPNVGSSGFVIENAGDSVYDHWAFRTEGVNLDLIGSYRDLARAQLDIQQTSAQGTATVTIPELGDLRIPVIHQQAMNIADRETRLTFMLMGYDVDVRASTARHVELNQEQLQVVQEALQSVAMARGEYLTTGGTLKSWITSDDRQRVYETLDTQTAAAMRTVEDVVAGRGATGTDRRGNPQFVAADRDRYLQQITQGRTTMTTSVTQIRTAGAEQERYWNYGCAAAELVGAGLVSLIPGGQIVVAGYFLTRGIESFEETRVGAGGWEQMSTTQQVLGVGGIALGALGFVSAGGSLITREAALGLQEGMALSRPMLALSTATRVSGYVMIAGGVGMAGLTMYDLHEQGEQARRSGGHEPDWLDYGFQMFNAAQPFLLMGGQRIGMRYPSLMYSNGVGGYAFRGFMAVMGHSSAMASEEAYIGAIEAMSRARHQIMAQAPTALPHIEGSLGRSLDPHEVIALQQQFTVRGADGRSRISIPDPVAAAALIDSYSRHYDTRLSALSPDAHARLLTFQRELGFGPDVAMALMDHYGNGLTDVNMADVSRYVTRSGAAASREQSLLGRLNEEQRRGFGDLTQRLETSRGSPLRLDERVALLERFGTSVPDAAAAQSFLEGRRVMPDQTVTAGPYDIRQYESTQYARDLSEAAMRLNSLARNEAGVVMEGVSEIRRGGDGSVTYVVGQGENAVTVTQQQVSIAADTIQYAQRLMARGETPLAQAREQILGEIKAQLRNEGVPPAQVDAIAEARTQAVVRLAADPQFREATRTRPGPGVPSPMPRMLERALSVTDSVVQAEGQRRTQPLERARRAQVQGARTSVRDETILRSDVIFNTFDGMRTTEQGRREFLMGTGEGAVVYSQQHVALAQDFATYGDRLVNRGSRSLTDVASEIRSEIRQNLVRGGMDGTQADTVAAERSRAILRLATDAEFRSASQRGNPTDRGAMMRRALDASRDMVPQEARPRAAVPGRARPPPLPVTEEARSSFRGMRAELQDLGHQGTAHVEGEFRTTYMFGGRSFEMQQGQDAATSASAADNIVRRRAAGEDVTPQRARQIARDLGVPERLLDQTVALSENAQFRAAVEANSGEGRMRAALGMPPAEAPAAREQVRPQQLESQPVAEFSPQRFRETMAQEEASILADVDRLHATPDDIRHVAEGRRTTAVEWETRAEDAALHARRLEIEGASPAIVNDAYARAGRDERIAFEYRRSADRLDAEAGRREGAPQAERTPQALERDVGAIESNPALEAVIRSRGLPEGAARIARVLESIMPGSTELTSDQIRTWPEEYRNALERINQEEPQTRVNLIADIAREINYERQRAVMEPELRGRVERGEITQQVMDDAMLLHAAMNGGEVPISQISRLHPDAEPMRFLDGVMSRRGSGMAEPEALVEVARMMGAPAPAARRSRAAQAVEQQPIERLVSQDRVAEEILRRAGYRLENGQLVRTGPPRWSVGGEEMGGEVATTGRQVRAIEDVIRAQVAGGQEVDVIVVAGDKTKLNQINQLLGREHGDRTLDAYRGIFRRTMLRAAGEVEGGSAFLIRPSASGDETIAVIVVPRGEGQRVRESIQRNLTQITDEVVGRVTREGRSGGLYDVVGIVQDPRALIGAAVDVGTPVSIRRSGDGVSATRVDGSSGLITRPDGHVEFLAPQVRMAEEEGTLSFAPGLRQRMGVTADTEIRRAPNVADIQPTDTVTGIVFEIRLAVTDPSVLADMEGHLATTRKGLAEVETNRFGIRGLNTFLGHYGSNRVINEVEGAVGQFATQRGLTIRRLGTMKYEIEGGTAADYQALRTFIDDRLQASGMRFRSAEYVPPATVRGVPPDEALAQISNGHLRLEWGSQNYDTANALISSMAIGNDATLGRLLGGDHGLQPIIDLVRRNPSIRNMEDLMIALREPSIAGPNGPALRDAFTRFVEQSGGQFRRNLRELPEQMARDRAATAGPQERPISGPEVVVQVRQEAGRIEQLYERYQEARTETRAQGPDAWRSRFNASELETIDRVNATARRGGYGRTDQDMQRVFLQVADARVRRPAVELPQGFSGMPEERYSTRVPVVGGGEVPFGQAPRARLLSRLDSERSAEGTTAGVFRAEMIVDGQPTEAVVKVFRDPQPDSNHGIVSWDAQLAHAQREYQNLQILADLGIGPRPLGFVQVDGNIGIAMERVRGVHLDELTPADMRRVIRPETFRQLGEAWQRILNAGYGNEDFQFAILTQDQMINGVMRHAGDVVVWDAGGLQRTSELQAEFAARGQEYRPFTADQVVRAEQNTVDVTLMRDHLGSISGPRRDALRQFLEGVLSPADVSASHGDVAELSRRYIVRGREERAQAGGRFLSEMQDRMAARRLEVSLRAIESDSGVQLLPAREGGPGPGGGRREEGGGPQAQPPPVARLEPRAAQQSPRDMASSLISGQIVDVPPAMRDQVSVEAARQLFNNSEGQFVQRNMADLARRVALDERGVRPDAEAARQFALLPQDVQTQMRRLWTEDTRFIMAAQGSDATFQRHITTPRLGGRLMDEVGDHVRPRVVEEHAQPQVLRATGTDSAAPVVQEQPQGVIRQGEGGAREGPVGIARPGPVAMADQTRRGGPTGEGGGRPPVPREERQGGERGGRGGGGPRRERAAAPQQERSVTDVTGMQAAELPARVTFGREIVQEGRNFVEFTYDTGFGAGEERTRTIRIQAPEAQEGRAPGPAELRAHFERELGREITRIHEERRTALVTEERNAGGLSRRLGQLNDDIQNSRLTLDDAVARYPEYADALRSIHGVDPAQRPAEIARYAERIETERAAPDSSLDTRALHHIARDYIRAPADRLGFAGRPNEMAVGRLLGQDPAYRAAVARGDMPEAIRIAREYENLLDTVEQTTPTVTRGQHVDVVQNARQVIAIGDIHGDVYGMLDQLTRSGVLRDTRPDLPRYDSSVPLDQRYQLREIPEGTQIVFMGDLIDRGTTSPEVVDFVQRLQRQVRDAGSEVHVIRGNHEAIFLRFVDLFRNMSTADVQRAVADPTATFDFSHSLDGATLTIPDPSRPGQMRTVSYSDFLSEYGISSSSATLNDVGIAASNAGLGPTVAALIRRYGSWENAVREMSVPGGALDFMRSTRGAVIIDGNLFTHGGPVMSAHSVADMDAHFQGLFGDVHNHWAWNYQLGGSPGAALRQFAGRDDHSVDYVTRQGWHQRLETAEGRQWMRDMGIDHIYVGHDATDSITAISPRVTNLDARLSEAYGAHGGVLVIDPLERGPHVRVVTGRDEVPSAMRARQRDGIAARGTDVQDFTNGRQRTEVLRGNRISEAAQSFMEPQVTLGMRRGELPEGVEYAGMGTEARSGQRYAEFHMGIPRGETEIIVINAPPETMTAPQRRQYYQRELAREVHRLHEQRTRQLEDQERLIDLHGSTAPSPELGLRLPVGQDNIQIRGVARILEQIVNSSRDDASIRRDYPEYADAVQSIRGARGLSADDRAREIIERAHGILEERALSRASEAGVVRLVEGGGDLVTARRAMDRAVSEARRISRIEQGNPTEMMVVRLVNDAAAHSESPRAVVALEVLQGLAADGARIANSTPAQRQADPALALGYEVAMARARSEGRTTPSAEDRIFGAAAMQASGPMADIMLSYVQDINARAGQRAPEIVVQLAHTASFIFDRLPIGNPPSASDAGLVSGALDLASSLHMAGVRDAQSLFSNERGNGVLDLFPVTDASSHGRAIDAMRQLEAIAGSVPEHVTVTREQRGRTFQVEVPREQALETVLSYALDDARRLPPDARQTYLRSVRQGFAWNERVNERIGGMLVDNQGRATPASITDSRLPLIAYTFDDPTGILVASLDSSLIRNELRPNRIFRTVVDLVSSLQRARQQGHEADTAWVDLVRQKLEYMQSLESRGLSRKDRESAVKAFMREMLPQIQELYDNYVRSELQPTQLTQIARDLRGQDTREGFINTLGTAYTQMLPREMGITPEFAAANTELVLDLSAYRRDLERYTSAGTAPGVRNEQFAGYATWGDQRQPHMRGEAFDEVIPVMDAATRARAQGPEAFRDFKFSQEFHDELVRDHPRLLPDGRAQGEALFQTWRQDYRSTETVGGARYDISETGSFEDAVYGGRVRGELTCQDMRYGNMHVVGVVGTVELPWVRQMIVRNPDTGEIVYRRRLFLVQGDNGQPVLLMQPEYGARDMPGRAEVRDLITAQLRQRYEALGVEVRDMPNAALSIATPTTQYPQGVNAGYSTYSSGRSPFFYMDSNAWWIGVHSPDAGLTMGQNGLHSRQPGQQIHFGSGWSGRIDITRAVPGQQ